MIVYYFSYRIVNLKNIENEGNDQKSVYYYYAEGRFGPAFCLQFANAMCYTHHRSYVSIQY